MISITETLSTQYAEEMISELLTGPVPFQFFIGNTPVKPLFGSAAGEGEFHTRRGASQNVNMTATYRMLGTAVEICVRLENVGCTSSPQIHDIDFCDLLLPDAGPRPSAFCWEQRRILYSVGSPTCIYDFQPREEDITRPEYLFLEEAEARASAHFLPYFNCTSKNVEGVVAAIGWSGRWKARFTNEDGGMRIRFTYPADFYMEPGESVELPRVLLMPWKRQADGDRELRDTFVLFRRLMRNHILPKRILNGRITLRSWGADPVELHLSKLANMKKYGITCDAYGIDAGWYAPANSDWWHTVGDWQEDASVHPNGLEWLSDRARQSGADGFWLWLEFERAMSTARTYQAHPEHYMNGNDPEVHLVNMGDTAARDYMKTILYPLIRRIGLTMFRVDFNFDPNEFFVRADAAGRNGLTELKYYAGLYTFFQELLDAFPELYIDNCASGGRRLDYRMCSCGTPVNCRSDYFTIPGYDPNGQQAQTLGLSRWLPVQGDSGGSMTFRSEPPRDTYRDRSVYGSSFSLVAFAGELSEEEGRMYRKIVDEARIVMEYMTRDFYPLTGYSYSSLDWCAFEGCMEDGSGAVVLAFRREGNASPEQVFALQGLTADAQYLLRDLDFGELGTCSGSELAKGLAIRIEQARDSRIILLTRQQKGADHG